MVGNYRLRLVCFPLLSSVLSPSSTTNLLDLAIKKPPFKDNNPSVVWTRSPKSKGFYFLDPCRPRYVSTGFFCQKIKKIDHLFNLPTSLENSSELIKTSTGDS